jgi:protein Cut8
VVVPPSLRHHYLRFSPTDDHSSTTMNVLLSPQPRLLPHHHETQRLSPPRSLSPYHNNMSGRKRKADEDGDDSMSPMSSPAPAARQLIRPAKRARATELIGRPLTLPRLLETLDSDQLRMVLQRICESHPAIGQEVVTQAPRPSVASALGVLEEYQTKLKAAIPYGESSPDYTYQRIRQPLVALTDALADFTPQYLPPNETQATVSLQYLDGATQIIHQLPDWNSTSYRHHKDNAYDEISRAWALVITEATKRGGGFNLHTGGWDQKLSKHNELSGGRMSAAMNAMAAGLGWISSGPASPPSVVASDPNSRFSQLMAGSFGAPVRVGF